MTNNANNVVAADESEIQDKPDIHQTIGSKKL